MRPCRMLGPSAAMSAAMFYFICSISMNFLNKAVVSSYDFNYPFSIMACQMIVTILFLDTLRLTGSIKLPNYSLKDGVDFLPASLSFAVHATVSLTALHGMNIPMYGAVKRCTPFVNLVLSVTILKKPLPSRLLTLSIGIITMGAFVAGMGDLQFDPFAYSMGTFAVFAQASYLTLVQKCSEHQHKGILEMIYVNAYNTLPVFLTMSVVLGEPAQIALVLVEEDFSFYLVFSTLIVSGGVLTYSQFLCCAVCSALTTSIVGVSKSILQTIIGFFTFGGVKFHPVNVTGLVLNILGGVVYTYVKFREGGRTRTTSRVRTSSCADDAWDDARKSSRTFADSIDLEGENKLLQKVRDV